MNPPPTESEEPVRKVTGARSSVLESLRVCGLPGAKIDKEELKSKLTIPKYLRVSIRLSITAKDPSAGVASYLKEVNESRNSVFVEGDAPEGPIFVFINSKSGGRHGPELKKRLLELMGEEQVLDLSEVRPHEFVRFGLRCLDNIAELGDRCAKETRGKLRVIVAGGDGSVGWVLGSLAEVVIEGGEHVPPVGIIPLGTGNDLSRSFGWGGSFPFAWKSAIKRTLTKAIKSPICLLDSWKVVVSMPHDDIVKPPHALKQSEDHAVVNGDFGIEGKLPEKMKKYEGVFYNYFSIGMDARVAYGFHRLRDDRPYLAQGPIANKMIYSGYSCTQGWFFTPCISDPRLRGLKNILKLHVKKKDTCEWEAIPVPKSVRAIVALNLRSYGSGRNPWGRPSQEYMGKRGFVEAHENDGMVEIFGLKQGWHASFVMVELISAKHISQASSIRLEIRGGEWRDAYMQMDGEPWKQPISSEESSFVEVIRVPFQSPMLRGD